VHSNVQDQMETYQRTTPEGALVVRIGYNGEHESLWKVWDAKNQRVIFIGAENPLPEYQVPRDPEMVVGVIDMGFAYGDASVTVEKYPVPILPPSGYMQVIAYESLNVEVLNRLGPPKE
jgi:hypothetical protein